MSVYQTYAENETVFLVLTGYTRPEFEALLPYFETAYLDWMRTHRLDGQPRGNRRYSNYRNCPLPTLADKLFFILSYLKSNNLQTVQGALFGLTQPKANLWIHCLHAVLQLALTAAGELPAREMTAVTYAPEEPLYFHDGTERPILRPRDPTTQREYYSGKKTAHRQA